jgi:hypothetical protein
MNERTKSTVFMAIDAVLFLGMWIPYILVAVGLSNGEKYFHLFPTGLVTLLPVGIFVLISTYVMTRVRGYENKDVSGCGWFTVLAGIAGIMIILAFTGP